MQRYFQQLLEDIAIATAHISLPFTETELHLHDWLSPEDEDKTAPVRKLEEWTGIKQEMLPSHKLLDDEQVHQLLEALNKMLDAYNWCFVLQTEVPERVQYETIRQNFSQNVKVKRWHMGFFELCKPGTEHGKCALGEHCQCAFYAEFFSGFTDEELSPEEERARALDIEVTHIKRKYGDDWMKYYPYHLDAAYDDDAGNPYNYGFDDADDEDEEDNWWRK